MAKIIIAFLMLCFLAVLVFFSVLAVSELMKIGDKKND